MRGSVTITGTARSDDFAFYRLAYFQGLTPSDLQTLAEEERSPKTDEPLAVWDTTELEEGLYTLLLTVVGNDGRFEEVTVHVTVDNTPPEADIRSPLPDQQLPLSDEWVIIQAAVSDNASVDRVEFYVDGGEEPFAVSTVPPYTEKWPMPGPGCYSFQAKAVDAAGNVGESTAARVCVAGD